MPRVPAAERRARDFMKRAEDAACAQNLNEAVRLIDAALAARPRDAERRLRSAFFRTGLKLYDEAGEELARAAKDLGPADDRPARALAHLEYVQGRYAPALEAVRAVRSPSFQDDFLRGVLSARLGRADEARRCLDELKSRSADWGDLLLGFQKAMAGDWAAASAAADRAAASERPFEQPARLTPGRIAFKLKSWQARGGAASKSARGDAPKGRLHLISLGVDPPRHLTFDALQAIEACDVLFVNVASDMLMDLLAAFCPGEVRPINFVNEEAGKRCAREVFRELGPGRTVGYATYGHVMVYGPLTKVFTRFCRRRGIPCRAWAGISIIDRLLADAGVVLGDGFGGFQLYDVRELALRAAPLNGRAALAVYLNDVPDGGAAFYAGLQKTLLAAYPASHEAQLWGPTGLVERLRIDAVGAAHRKFGSQQQLFVPPSRSVA